jgi:L-threonylcarbamoyladenylate synthase
MPEAELLKAGKVGVMPTDTLYGLLASIEYEAAVRRVYELKHRSITKPCIILISSRDELARFGITPFDAQSAALDHHWPGPVSIIFPCGPQAPEWLHGGTHTLALRLPADEPLRALLQESGPLIAPSANPEGSAPATTVDEARAYFGDAVDFYKDGGVKEGQASTLLWLETDGTITVLR